jgi:hypothetical protein
MIFFLQHDAQEVINIDEDQNSVASEDDNDSGFIPQPKNKKIKKEKEDDKHKGRRQTVFRSKHPM